MRQHFIDVPTFFQRANRDQSLAKPDLKIQSFPYSAELGNLSY